MSEFGIVSAALPALERDALTAGLGESTPALGAMDLDSGTTVGSWDGKPGHVQGFAADGFLVRFGNHIRRYGHGDTEVLLDVAGMVQDDLVAETRALWPVVSELDGSTEPAVPDESEDGTIGWRTPSGRWCELGGLSQLE